MEGISAIVLAAGESTRMGRLKALLPWQGVTLVEYQIDSLRRSGVADVVLVTGHRGDEVGAVVQDRLGVNVVHNPDYRQGKTTSIKTGLRQVSWSAMGVLVMAVDQPRPVDILEAVVRAHMDGLGLITCPAYRGHIGHPIIFSSKIFPELMSITEELEGLRDVTLRHTNETHIMEMDNPIVTVDLNSPEDLSEAHRLFSIQ